MTEPRCVICNGPVEPWWKGADGYGHNPDPVKTEGRCCDACNHVVVIPARLKVLRERFAPQES